MRQLVLLLLFLCVPLAAGPVSDYYLTNGDGGLNWLIQGDAATSYAQGTSVEYPIAVSGGQVRTLSVVAGGSLYDLDFTLLGTPYARPGYYFYDGTSDGTYNYSVDYMSGDVFRMNLDWSNPVVLFNSGFGGAASLGITYDPVTESLWLSQWSGDRVVNFSMAGTQLASFSAGHNMITSLAMDYADHTLWMGQQGVNEGTFRQFTTAGVAGQVQTYENMLGQNTLGGEFALPSSAVPEPAAGLLFGGALAVLLVLRRRP